MSISAKEIARELGLSAATVSVALNNKGGISEKTRIRVLDTARKCGYNFSKKNDSEAGKGVIQFIIYKNHGVIVADTPFFAQIAEGVDIGCKLAGYELQVTYFYGRQNISDQIRAISGKNCQGILLLGTEMEPAGFQPFSQLKVPIVVLDTYSEELNCDAVLINNIQGACLATNYLIDHGMRTVGYLHSSYPIGNFSERANGYYKALRHRRIQTDHPYVHRLAPSMEGAYIDMLSILQRNPPVADAYFADNDLIAVGAMRAFKQCGYQIPEDVSIVGFDDMPICEFLEPKLTTITVPERMLAELAVKRLVGKIKNPESIVTKIEVSVSLHERISVKE